MAETRKTVAKARRSPKAPPAARQSMTADDAKALGLDPTPYGKAPQIKQVRSKK